MARTLPAIVAIALIAASCDPGPLPTPAPSPKVADPARDYQRDWFPTNSEDPLPLNRAILDDKPGEVRKLLEQGADPNARWSGSGDRLALQDVLESEGFGYRISDPTEIIRLLLTHGADPNAKWCPFESRGTDPRSCRSARGFTPLMSAAGSGLTEVVAMLLEAGADAAPRTWSGESALDLATTEIAFERISRSLFPVVATRDRNALNWLRDDTEHPIMSDATLFSLAIERAAWFRVPPPPPPLPGFQDNAGSVSLARDRDRKFEDGVVERFRTLLRIGADPNQRFSDYRDNSTPLGKAASWRLVRAARWLLTAGIDVNQRECFQVGYDKAVMRPTFDPACTRDNGVTPLMSSASSGHREFVALLLEFKADRSLKDWAGRSARDYAKDRVVRDLLSANH